MCVATLPHAQRHIAWVSSCARRAGLRGKARQWFGWIIIIFSDLAFGSVTVFEMKRLFVSEVNQQPVVNWTMALADLGLAAVLVALAALMIWRLVDLFEKKGRWSEELAESGYHLLEDDLPADLGHVREGTK